MTTLSGRLRDAMTRKKVTQKDLATTCHISPAAVSKWFSGGSLALKAEHAFKVARLLNVDAEWLVTGKGEPVRLDARTAGVTTVEFESKHIELLRMYKRLPKEIRFPIRQMIETLAAAQRESFRSWVEKPRERNDV